MERGRKGKENSGKSVRALMGSKLKPQSATPFVAALVPNIIKSLIIPQTLAPIQTLNGIMGSQQRPEGTDHHPRRRPFCQRCCKPLRLCLCSRLKSPPLDNPIAVTVLQHSLEKHHPLNSTRVARLGLKNLSVVTVTDVNFTARFTIRPIDHDRSDPRQKSNLSLTHLGQDRERPVLEKTSVLPATGYVNGESGDVHSVTHLNSVQDGPELVFDKYRVACSPHDLRVTIERTAKPDISWVLDTPIGRALASNGFTVSKLQRKQLHITKELQDFEEFDIAIPQGAALLFPNGNSAMDLDEVGFEVKHLIVLDGTWAKAQRMYNENPWLKLLPHLRLNPREESLYSEVRHQPKPGCLSTVESIVCALKGLGDDMDGLDDLLEVFGSMVGDQRRCKDEGFKAKGMS